MAPARIRMRRPGTPGPRGGGVYVTQMQRARLSKAAIGVVDEHGYNAVSILNTHLLNSHPEPLTDLLGEQGMTFNYHRTPTKEPR